MPEPPSEFEAHLAAMLRERAARAPGERDARLVAFQATAQPMRRSGFPWPIAAGTAVFIALVIIARFALESAEAGGEVERQLPDLPAVESLGAFELGLPEGWRVYQEAGAHGSGWGLVGYVASLDIAPPCTRSDSIEQCDLKAYRLEPSTAVITILSVGRPDIDPVDDAPEGSSRVTIAGMPAVVSEVSPDPQTAADVAIEWIVAVPESTNYYRFSAEIRGPEVDALRSQVNQIVDSLRWASPVLPLPTSQEATRAALANLLEVLRAESPAYGCFSSEPGAASTAQIAGLPLHPPLPAPLPVTCTSEIHPTPRQVWDVTLTFAWEAGPERVAGSYAVTATVSSDGTLVDTRQSGDQP